MNLLFVYQDARLPSSRVRILQMIPHLEARGAACEAIAYPRSWRAARALLPRLKDADAVVLQKRMPSLIETALWRRARGRVVLDIDDAVMFRPRPRSGSYESPGRLRRFERTARLCDGFICGNTYLASFVRGFSKPVLVAPSPVPVDVPRRGADPVGSGPGDGSVRAGPVRIGWIGTRGNVGSLLEILPLLRELARERDFVLRVISDAEVQADGLIVENVRWTLAGQEQELARLDIGLMPMDDTPWSRGKCAYKLLQYMAAEVAAVGSRVGMNCDLVAHGQNGMLAASAAEWRAALAELVDDAPLRTRLGREGRATVVARYSYDVVADSWIAFLRDVIARNARGSAAPR